MAKASTDKKAGHERRYKACAIGPRESKVGERMGKEYQHMTRFGAGARARIPWS